MTSPKQRLHLEIIKQMVTLSTAGFGLVAALAWNQVITEIVENYIKRYFAQDSGLISLVIYAVIVTTIAVLVTLQLTRIQARLEEKTI